MITKEVVKRLSSDTKELFDFYDKKGLRKSKKQKSEDISGLLETAMADLVEGAVAPKVDSEPDIRLNGNPVEIKTSSGETWRGGAYSKRGGHFIFVTWKLDENNIGLRRSGNGLEAKTILKIHGKKAKRKISKGKLIKLEDFDQ